MSNKRLSNTKRHIINLTDISNLISSWLMNFKCPAPLPLRHRFHCPIRVTLNACTNPIQVMPFVINSLHYPQSNRPFSHNRRRISHHPVPSYSAVTPIFKTQHPIPIPARDRYFQSASITKKWTVTSVVTTPSLSNRNFSTDLPVERAVNVRSVCLF